MIGTITESRDPLYSQRMKYNLFRNILFLKIHLRNPKRSGALAELTMDEYNNRTRANGQTRIHVSNHKTDYKYGSSILTLEKDDELWMDGYEQNCATSPSVSPRLMKSIFLSNLMVFAIQVQTFLLDLINHVTRSAGCIVQTSATLMRKSAVTAMYKDDPTQKSDMTVLMDHDELTAQLHYKSLQKTNISSRMAIYAYNLCVKK